MQTHVLLQWRVSSDSSRCFKLCVRLLASLTWDKNICSIRDIQVYSSVSQRRNCTIDLLLSRVKDWVLPQHCSDLSFSRRTTSGQTFLASYLWLVAQWCSTTEKTSHYLWTISHWSSIQRSLTRPTFGKVFWKAWTDRIIGAATAQL